MNPFNLDWKDIAEGLVMKSASSGLTRFASNGPSRLDLCDFIFRKVLISLEQDDDAVPPIMIVVKGANLDEGQDFVDRMIAGDPAEALSEEWVEARVLPQWRADLPLGIIARGYPCKDMRGGFIVTLSHAALADQNLKPTVGKPFLQFKDSTDASHWAECLGLMLEPHAGAVQ